MDIPNEMAPARPRDPKHPDYKAPARLPHKPQLMLTIRIGLGPPLIGTEMSKPR